MLTRSNISSIKKSALVYRRESRRPSPEKHQGGNTTLCTLWSASRTHQSCDGKNPFTEVAGWGDKQQK
eukprot:14685595-Ditylum_brightwellii.AAC.1